MSAHLVDQLSAGGQYPHEDCGESCVASILVDAGHVDSVHDIEWFDTREGDNPDDGTGERVHLDRLAAAGIAAHAVSGDFHTIVTQGAARGLNRWMAAIWSNAAGSPYSGPGCFGHWVLVDGVDDVGYSIMQPVGGHPQHYTRSQLEDNLQSPLVVIQVDVPVGADAVPATGGDDLTPDQLLNLKRLPVWMERLHHENWPSDPNAQENDIDVYARQIGDDLQFEGVITAIHQTFEANHQPSTEELLAAVKAKVGA